MTPSTWRDMVERTRELELALGSSVKQIESNEKETVVVQRRCLRAKTDLAAGTALQPDMLEALRPAPKESVAPYDLPRVTGTRLTAPLKSGECLTWTALADAAAS
jgi:N-acetylneuraminate synthase